jgi:hypothetical protein
MGICSFKSFTKWLTIPLVITKLATTALAEPELKFKTLSLEDSLTRKAEIISVNTNKTESLAELGISYNPEEKTIFINEKSRQNEKGEYLGLNTQKSKLYIITPKENFEFDNIQYGYFPEEEKWERLIPEGKNPSAGIKSWMERKALSEIFKKIERSGSKSIFDEIVDWLGGEKELEIEKISYQLGEGFGVKEIPVYTPEGMEFRPISELEVKIKLETNPNEIKKAVVIADFYYSIENYSNKILRTREMIIIPFIVPGSLERKADELTLNEKILETLHKEANLEEWEDYLKKTRTEMKKYIPQKEELSNELSLHRISYTRDIGKENSTNSLQPSLNYEIIDAQYINNNQSYRLHFFIIKGRDFFEKDLGEVTDEDKVYYNKNDDVFCSNGLELINPQSEFPDEIPLFKKYIERLNLKPYIKD